MEWKMLNLNLLPWRVVLRQSQQRSVIFLTIASVMVSGLFILSFYIYLSLQISGQAHKNSYLSEEFSQLHQQVVVLNEQVEIRNELLNKLALIESINQQRYRSLQLFNELSRIVPDSIKLSKVQSQSSQVSLMGEAQSNSDVAELMENINKSEYLKDPKLNDVNAYAETGLNKKIFVLNLELGHGNKVIN
jgi:type IV pilus assembly protein PilN